jgi:hypothetical protein
MTYNKSFAVTIPKANVDPYLIYKQALVNKLIEKYPQLTVAGLDAPFYTTGGVEIKGINYAKPGHTITFGTSKSFDVNWVKNNNFLQGNVPVHDLKNEWNTVMDKLEAFAEARKPKQSYNPYIRTYSSGCSCFKSNMPANYVYVAGNLVEIYDNFIKVGYTIIPRYAKPETFSRYTSYQLETIKTIVVTIKSAF